MRVFGLTGGIATGKTTAGKLFKKHAESLVLFDADACVHSLYQEEEVLIELADMLGDDVINEDGSLNRAAMRDILFSDTEKKKAVQDLIHPRVRKECLAMRMNAEHSGDASLFIADVPLLFEGGFDLGQEANLVVAVSQKTQVQRLKMRNGFDDATVYAILAAQLPISHKVKCADVVLWNEGPIHVLETQIKRFINQIHHE